MSRVPEETLKGEENRVLNIHNPVTSVTSTISRPVGDSSGSTAAHKNEYKTTKLWSSHQVWTFFFCRFYISQKCLMKPTVVRVLCAGLFFVCKGWEEKQTFKNKSVFKQRKKDLRAFLPSPSPPFTAEGSGEVKCCNQLSYFSI